MKCLAVRQQGCRDDERIVDRQTIALGNPQGPFVRLDRHRLDRTDRTDLGQDFAYLDPRHAQLARSDRHELVQNLDADRPPDGEQFLCPIGLAVSADSR